MTTAPALVASRTAARRARPCVATADGEHCIAGLLLGVACCADGTCACCRAIEERMQRAGFEPAAIASAVARTREGLAARCPVCGFTPPPAASEFPVLPRLERTGVLGSSQFCRFCGRALLGARRHYCSRECWNAWVLETRRDARETS